MVLSYAWVQILEALLHIDKLVSPLTPIFDLLHIGDGPLFAQLLMTQAPLLVLPVPLLVSVMEATLMLGGAVEAFALRQMTLVIVVALALIVVALAFVGLGHVLQPTGPCHGPCVGCRSVGELRVCLLCLLFPPAEGPCPCRVGWQLSPLPYSVILQVCLPASPPCSLYGAYCHLSVLHPIAAYSSEESSVVVWAQFAGLSQHNGVSQL